MRIVLTFTGRDQPGIVHQLAEVVRDFGGNWKGSRMARLAGRFAGMLDIVRSLSQVLLGHGINVLELSTHTIKAPLAGGSLSRATAQLALLPATDLALVRLDLEHTADDLLVELHPEDT